MLFYDEITNHGKRRSCTTPPILRADFSTMMEEDDGILLVPPF
jgi:hypothetical protein